MLELLGSGGMGEVYKAEQRTPIAAVAIKIIKLGFDTPRDRSRDSNRSGRRWR